MREHTLMDAVRFIDYRLKYINYDNKIHDFLLNTRRIIENNIFVDSGMTLAHLTTVSVAEMVYNRLNDSFTNIEVVFPNRMNTPFQQVNGYSQATFKEIRHNVLLGGEELFEKETLRMADEIYQVIRDKVNYDKTKTVLLYAAETILTSEKLWQNPESKISMKIYYDVVNNSELVE